MPGTITLDFNNVTSYRNSLTGSIDYNTGSYHDIMGIPDHTYYHSDPRVYINTSDLVINGMCVEDYLLSLLRNLKFNKEFRRLLTKNLEIE